MKIRFQADADFNEDIVSGVLRREPGIDFQSAGEASFFALDDLSVLARAALDHRVLPASFARRSGKTFSTASNSH